MTDNATGKASSLLSRRDGRAAVCTPWGLGKVACDHRYRRRRRGARCHHAELTAAASAQAERRPEVPADPDLPPRPADSAPSAPSRGFFGFTAPL
ncbi:hypothetical protein E5D57_006149 [Metarhizium anisopliae]|nr:hypothetical protein E5D57_006149 [Metarhizium anisopliae]